MLDKVFSAVPAGYGPVPFWGWNGDMREDEILRQMEEMRRNHVTEVVLWPCLGMEVEFLSGEFFRRIRFACQKALELGIKIWLWDDYNWPSGTAAGRLPEIFPQYCARYLRYEVHRVSVTDSKEITLSLGTNEMAAVQAVRQDKSEILDLTEFVEQDELRYPLPEGEWTICCFFIEKSNVMLEGAVGTPWSKGLPGCLDVLNPRAVRAFIGIVHEAYAREVGEYFGKSVRGFFSDEPAMSYDFKLGHDRRGYALPWTERFFDDFEKTKGYDLKLRLYELVVEQGNRQVRRDFWDFATELYSRSYHRQMRKWCENHSLLYSGHLFEEEPLEFQIKYEGSFYRSSREFQIPGIDHLLSSSGFDEGQYIPPKLVTSVARATGAKRVMAESFSANPWNLTIKDMKRVVDWLFAMGINLVSPCAAFYSLKGMRKRAVPPSIFYQASWWTYFQFFSDYVARVSYLLSQGERQIKIAVLYPFSSLSGEIEAGFHLSAEGEKVKHGLYTVVKGLLQAQLDFDFIFEEVAADKGIDERYEILILPPGDISDAVEQKIDDFKEAGGKVFCWEDVDLTADEFVGQRILEVRKDGRLAEDVLVYSRMIEGKDFFFVANTTGEKFPVTMEIKRTGVPCLWNAETGEIQRLRWEQSDGKSVVEFFFEPYQSVAISVDESDSGVREPVDISLPTSRREIVRLDGDWQFETLKPNVYPLKRWAISIDQKGQFVWRETVEGKIPNDLLAEPFFLAKGRFELDFVPPDLALIFEQDRMDRVRINGITVQQGPERDYYLDESGMRLDISSLVRPGLNEIEARYYLPEYERKIRTDGFFVQPLPAIVEPVFLVGTFSVSDDRLVSPRRLLKTGSWSEQGFPFYSGGGSYRCRFNMGKEDIGQTIFLEANVHDGVMEVRVNDRTAGVRTWEPYRLNISDLVQVGENDLEIVVTNTNANLLEQPIPSGLRWAKITRRI